MWTNQCWLLGQFAGAVVQRFLVDNHTSLAYQLPLGLQWVFPIPIMVAAFLAPESPWFSVRKGRIEEARKAIEKLTNLKEAPEEYSIENHVAMLVMTNRREEEDKKNGGGKMGYLDCFKGVNMRRTITCCAIWSMQNSCGAALMQFSTYFFLQAGLGAEKAFTFTLGQVSTLSSPILHLYQCP